MTTQLERLVSDIELSGDALLERAADWYRAEQVKGDQSPCKAQVRAVYRKADDRTSPENDNVILVFVLNLIVACFIGVGLTQPVQVHWVLEIILGLVGGFVYFFVSWVALLYAVHTWTVRMGLRKLSAPDASKVSLPNDIELRTKFWDHCISELRMRVDSAAPGTIGAQIREVLADLLRYHTDQVRLEEALQNITDPVLQSMLQETYVGLLEEVREKEAERDLLVSRQESLRRCVDQIEARVIQRRVQFDAVALIDEISERRHLLQDRAELRKEIMDAATVEIVGSCILIAQLATRIEIENRIDAAAQFEHASIDVQIARLESASDVPEIPVQLFDDVVAMELQGVSI